MIFLRKLTPLAHICVIIFSSGLVGCVLGHSSSSGSLSSDAVEAPLNLSCPPDSIGGVGVATVLSSITIGQGSNIIYSISPSLPSGLSLNSTSGQFEGTPTVGLASTSFTISASNALGTATCNFNFLVDSTAPSAVVINDGGTEIFSNTNIPVSWTAATDAESSISRYDYSVGSAPGLVDYLPWTSAGNNLSTTINLPSIVSGTLIFINVRAISSAGLIATTVGDGIVYVNNTSIWADSALQVGSTVDIDGYYVPTYEDAVFNCTTSACSRVYYSTNEKIQMTGTKSRSKGSLGMYYQFEENNGISSNYSITRTKYCDLTGCTALVGDSEVGTGIPTDLSGSGYAYYQRNTTPVSSYRCFQGTCTSTPLNPFGFFSPSFITGYYSSAASTFVHYTDFSNYGFYQLANGASTVSTVPYENKSDKLWLISLRGSTYYINTCSKTGCTEVGSLGSVAPALTKASAYQNAIWFRIGSNIVYCTESACATISTAAASYNFSTSSLTKAEGVWLYKAGNRMFCTATACTATASTFSYYGIDGAGVGVWALIGGSNYSFCNSSGTCSTVIANAGIVSRAFNSIASGSWITKSNGVSYCTSSGCSLVDSSSSTYTIAGSNPAGEGVWVYDTVSTAIKYCTSTVCTSVTKPASMTEVSF